MSDEHDWLSSRSAAPPSLPSSLSSNDDFRRLFRACNRIESVVLEAFGGARHFDPFDPLFLPWTLAFRSIKTLDAVLTLADLGYGQQATILARTIIEDVVTAWWCRSQVPERLQTLMSAHEKSVAARIQIESLDMSNRLKLLEDVPTLDGDQLTEFLVEAGIDERRSSRHWTGQSVKKMASSVAQSMRPHDQVTLTQLLDLQYLVANLVTHNSPASLGTAVRSGLYFSRRPSDLLVHDALAIAYDAVSLLAVLLVDQEELTELDDMVERDRMLFVILREEADVGRNEQCPCGSGQKYKRCHGRRT